MLYSFITLATLCAVCIVAHGQQTGDENCETLPFQLHLIKGFCLRISSRSLIYLNIFSQRNTTNSEDCSEHAMAKWQSINAKVFATVKCSLLSSHRQVSLRYSIFFFHWMLNNNFGFPQGMLLLSRVLPQGSSRHPKPLLWSRRHSSHQQWHVNNGPAPQRASRMQMLQMRRLFTLNMHLDLDLFAPLHMKIFSLFSFCCVYLMETIFL